MGNQRIDELFRTPVCWLASPQNAENPETEDTKETEGIAVSSGIRLARNLKDQYFPARADDSVLIEIRDRVLQAVHGAAEDSGFDMQDLLMEDLSSTDRSFLLERHLISREFLNPRRGAALSMDRGHGISVMVNEEDHLRIQGLAPGMKLQELWQRISLFDDGISTRLEYAFDPVTGYLAGCPSNAGTGMRASVMLHLPALFLSGQMSTVTQGLSQMGMTLCGLSGDGSKTPGNLYRISNRTSLGETEQKILKRLQKAVVRICAHEKKTRLFLAEKKKDVLMNFTGRAYGLLKYSYAISFEDALNALSGVRLGADMGMFTKISIEQIDRLFLLIRPAHLQKFAEREPDAEKRDSLRASLLRETLQSGSVMGK